MIKLLSGSLFVIAIIVLAYGYWFGKNHGSLYVMVLDWAMCFERQSHWLTTWVRNVKSVDIRSSSCTIHRMPISVSEHPDTWWLWWAPLRHIGGKPYTFFSFTITFDQSSCA